MASRAQSAGRGTSESDVFLPAPQIAVLDGRGTILTVNEGWKRFSKREGLTWPDDSVGRNYLEVCDAATRGDEITARQLARGIRRIIAGEIEELTVEYPCHSPESERWFSVSATRLEGEDDRIVVVHSDVTESKHHERERRSLENQLIQARKMETLGQLAGGVAHDFSNLLMVILGQCDLLEDRLADHTELSHQLAEIRWAGERGASLSQQLLAFGRKQSLEPQPLDLNVVLSELEKMLVRLIDEHVRFRTVLAEAPVPALADHAQLEQAVINLAVNSRDAMPQGGDLVIGTANVELDADFVVENAMDPAAPTAPGPYVRLTVRDTGHGIAPEHLEHIFEPFFTTKGRGRGTGLGLAAVYGILRQHGGLITVESTPGHGTSFDLYLPRCTLPVEEVAGGTPAASPPRGSETLLLVEDDPSVRKVACQLLEALGYEVLEAGDHRAATEWVNSFSEPIHLLVTDVVMPEKSGPVLADELRVLRPDLKVLYMTGYTGDAPLRFPVDSSFALLRKPVRQDTLARAVRRLLDED